MLLRAVLLLIIQVQGITYLQVQVPGDEALPQHVQPVEVLSLEHQLLLAVGMVLQAEQAAAQQVGLPLGHKSFYMRSLFMESRQCCQQLVMSTADDKAICFTRILLHAFSVEADSYMTNAEAADCSRWQCAVSQTICIVRLSHHKQSD